MILRVLMIIPVLICIPTIAHYGVKSKEPVLCAYVRTSQEYENSSLEYQVVTKGGEAITIEKAVSMKDTKVYNFDAFEI